MKTKIFWGNQHIGKFDCTGKRETFGMKLKRGMFKLMKLLVAVAIIGASGYVYRVYSAPIETVTEQVKVDVSSVLLAEKIDAMKMDVVEQVRKCESNGYKETDGLIKFDSNEKASIGTMQFQIKTIITYYKQLYGQTITGKEAVMIALDNEKSGMLAKDIMFKSKNKSWDWANCTKWNQIEPQIDAIKKLEGKV